MRCETAVMHHALPAPDTQHAAPVDSGERSKACIDTEEIVRGRQQGVRHAFKNMLQNARETRKSRWGARAPARRDPRPAALGTAGRSPSPSPAARMHVISYHYVDHMFDPNRVWASSRTRIATCLSQSAPAAAPAPRTHGIHRAKRPRPMHRRCARATDTVCVGRVTLILDRECPLTAWGDSWLGVFIGTRTCSGNTGMTVPSTVTQRARSPLLYTHYSDTRV